MKTRMATLKTRGIGSEACMTFCHLAFSPVNLFDNAPEGVSYTIGFSCCNFGASDAAISICFRIYFLMLKQPLSTKQAMPKIFNDLHHLLLALQNLFPYRTTFYEAHLTKNIGFENDT